MTAALAALAIARFAVLTAPTSGTWVANPIGDSLVVVQLPGKLVSQPRNSLPDEGDWVRSVQEQVYSDDNVFVLASVFSAEPGLRIGDPQMREAMAALVFGMASADEKVRDLYSGAVWYGAHSGLRRRIAIGPEDSAFFVDAVVIGVEHRLVALVTVAVKPSDPVASRVVGTLRVRGSGN